MKTIQRSKTKIVVTDWKMEPSGRLELVRRIHDFATSHDPFVAIMMLTRCTKAWRVAGGRDAGVNTCIDTPMALYRLMTHIVKTMEDPRAFVRTPNYTGSDRRRKDLAYGADS